MVFVLLSKIANNPGHDIKATLGGIFLSKAKKKKTKKKEKEKNPLTMFVDGKE